MVDVNEIDDGDLLDEDELEIMANESIGNVAEESESEDDNEKEKIEVKDITVFDRYRVAGLTLKFSDDLPYVSGFIEYMRADQFGFIHRLYFCVVNNDTSHFSDVNNKEKPVNYIKMKYGFINLINMVKKQILNNIGCDVHVIGCSMFFDIERSLPSITARAFGDSKKTIYHMTHSKSINKKLFAKKGKGSASPERLNQLKDKFNR